MRAVDIRCRVVDKCAIKSGQINPVNQSVGRKLQVRELYVAVSIRLQDDPAGRPVQPKIGLPLIRLHGRLPVCAEASVRVMWSR